MFYADPSSLVGLIVDRRSLVVGRCLGSSDIRFKVEDDKCELVLGFGCVNLSPLPVGLVATYCVNCYDDNAYPTAENMPCGYEARPPWAIDSRVVMKLRTRFYVELNNAPEQ